MRFYFFILFFLEIGLGECLISQTREIVPDLTAQTDYEIGTSYAKKNQKKTLLYFRDSRSAGCLKMEKYILSDSLVKSRLNKDFVIVALLLNDQTLLSEEKRSKLDNKKIVTVGDYYIYLQQSVYHNDTQPCFIVLDRNGIVGKTIGYTNTPLEFLKVLE